VHIEETHGASKANVVFDSARKANDRCEIADQLIFSISKSLNIARATFLQAKYARNTKWANLNPIAQLDFQAQSNQWYLLNRRPEIQGVHKFQPPSDLLSSFNNPAIGTYGVFYRRSGIIDFTYSIAEMVSCASPTVANPKLAINGSLERYTIAKDSAVVCMSIDEFLANLLSFRVGAVIDRSVRSQQWLVSYVKEKAQAADVDEEILVAINSLTDDGFDSEDILGTTGDGVSVLVVLTP